jgi:hypothetical protein
VSKWDPKDPKLQLVTGTSTELVYSTPINVYTYWKWVVKINLPRKGYGNVEKCSERAFATA